MTLLEFALLLLIAGVCGSVGQAMGGYSRGGCLGAIAVGFVGALLGGWLADALGFPPIFVIEVGGRAFPVVWSIVGGALFVDLLGMLVSSRRR